MAEQGPEQKPPHRSIDMGNDLGSDGMTVQKSKRDTDEIFATEGWRQLTFEEAQQAYKDKGPIFGLYDPMETVYSRGDNASSARIVVKLSGRNRPDDFNHFKTIKYFVEEQ